METYREALNSKNPTKIKDGTEVSSFYTNMYLFIHWIITKTKRHSGYVNEIARNCNNCDSTDVLKVLMRIIADNKVMLQLNEENVKKLNDIYEHFQLITTHLDKYVRTNHRLIYPDETDNDDPRLEYDMIEYCNTKMTDFMSSNALEIDGDKKINVKSQK